jgi:hypothetical protein
MTSRQDITLVFKDQAGEYYLLPQETLAQGRVSAEHTAEVERLVTEGDDVTGHVIGVFTMPVLVAALRQLAEDTKLLDWLGQEVNSGGKA